jgi:hypothetical protein
MDEVKKMPLDTPVVEFAPGDEDEEKKGPDRYARRTGKDS